MPHQLIITCPSCAFSRTVPATAIPAGVRQATCPACKQVFSLNEESMRQQITDETLSVAAGSTAAPPAPPEPDSQAPPPLAAAPSSRPVPCTLSFAFHGTARDYFGIWIVNTLLKIVTVGIYSAWAKVRKRRFFYGSTTLHGQPFEYLADPLTLFKGWLIAAVAFVLYSIGTKVSPILSSVIALIVFAAFPWLLVRSRIFNARNSAYRNIRFNFKADYRQAYLVYAGLPILTGLTLGILAPYMLYRQKKFMAENSSYGSIPFRFTATVKQFYQLALKVALGFAAIVAAAGAMFGLAGGVAAFTGGLNGSMGGFVLLPFVILPVMYIVVTVYARTALANLSWNSTQLGSGRFRSSLSTQRMTVLFVTNALAIFCSLGLLVPWATVRMARYRFECLKLETADTLDDVLAAAGSNAIGAAGEEIGDLFDMPVEIAL